MSALQHGAVRPAVAFTKVSNISFPSTLLWARTQRMVNWLSRPRIRLQASIAAMAWAWPGPRTSVRAHLIAAVELTRRGSGSYSSVSDQ